MQQMLRDPDVWSLSMGQLPKIQDPTFPIMQPLASFIKVKSYTFLVTE